jgi:hypothetical protein
MVSNAINRMRSSSQTENNMRHRLCGRHCMKVHHNHSRSWSDRPRIPIVYAHFSDSSLGLPGTGAGIRAPRHRGCLLPPLNGRHPYPQRPLLLIHLSLQFIALVLRTSSMQLGVGRILQCSLTHDAVLLLHLLQLLDSVLVFHREANNGIRLHIHKLLRAHGHGAERVEICGYAGEVRCHEIRCQEDLHVGEGCEGILICVFVQACTGCFGKGWPRIIWLVDDWFGHGCFVDDGLQHSSRFCWLHLRLGNDCLVSRLSVVVPLVDVRHIAAAIDHAGVTASFSSRRTTLAKSPFRGRSPAAIRALDHCCHVRVGHSNDSELAVSKS